MFSTFFYLLRARGLKVTLTEWLAFVQAIDKGLADASFTKFYYLARSILVKSESEYDRFDGVFLEFFKDMPPQADQLPEELLEWLNNPALPGNLPDMGRSGLYKNFSKESIEKMFQERLQEQTEEHNGGNYWIGTGGASPFGNNGETEVGIRVGGRSQKRMAMKVAGERRYRDFRNDAGLNTRSFQTALRRLRQFSNRVDARRTELNINETIRETCDNAGHLKLVFEKPRKNTVKLMLLMDSGGSMDQYSRMCASLFQAVSKSNHFKDLKVFYFHNCFTRRFYRTPAIDYTDSVATDWILKNIDGSYKVIVVGDALMDPSELVGTYNFGNEVVPKGLRWLQIFKEHYPRMTWFTPTDNEGMVGGWWGKSYTMMKEVIDMKVLTVENLTSEVKKLMVAR